MTNDKLQTNPKSQHLKFKKVWSLNFVWNLVFGACNFKKSGGGFLTGFTLLETVVALAIILAAIVGPVALIIHGLFNFGFAKNRIIAANLAQEGIELIRMIREDNVICEALGKTGWSWNRFSENEDDKFGGANQNNKWTVDITDISTVITCNGNDIYIPRVLLYTPGQKLKLISSGQFAGFYGHSSGQETPFQRYIEVHVPPEQADKDKEVEGGDQMDVISTVIWNEKGTDRQIVLRERLYNWK